MIFCRKGFVSQCRKIPSGNPVLLPEFRVPIKFGEEEGVYQDFLSKIFCLTLPKKFAGNPSVLCFRKFPLAKKFMDKRGGIKMFCRFFLSHTDEYFRRGNLFCCINFGYRKNLYKKGANIKIFRRKSFVSHCRKIS